MYGSGEKAGSAGDLTVVGSSRPKLRTGGQEGGGTDGGFGGGGVEGKRRICGIGGEAGR